MRFQIHGVKGQCDDMKRRHSDGPLAGCVEAIGLREVLACDITSGGSVVASTAYKIWK